MLRVKYEAFKYGLTNREISEEYVSRIMLGKQRPGYKHGQSAERIARAIGWKGNPTELFEEIEVTE